MRRHEILPMTWRQVQLGKRYVHLPDTKTGDGRDVPLSPQALELLGNLPKNIRGDKIVFPLHFDVFKSAWRKAYSRSGIIALEFHDLRTTVSLRRGSMSCRRLL